MVIYLAIPFFAILMNAVAPNRKVYRIIMACLIFLLLSMRAFSVGGDLPGYKSTYTHYYDDSPILLFSVGMKEPLFFAYNMLIGKVSQGSFRVFIVSSALVFSAGLSYVIYRLSIHQWASWFFVICFSVLVYGLSSLRASFALILGFLATINIYDPFQGSEYTMRIDKRRIIRYYILSLLAVLFHYSSIIYFLVLPLWIIKKNSKRFYWAFMILVGLLVYYYGLKLIEIMGSVFFSKSNYEYTSEGGAGLIIVILVIRSFLSSLVRQEEKDGSYSYCCCLFELAFLTQLMAFKFSLMARVSDFVFQLGLIVFPNMFDKMKLSSTSRKVVMPFFVCLVFFVYYLRFLLSDSPGIVPYEFFWQSNYLN